MNLWVGLLTLGLKERSLPFLLYFKFALKHGFWRRNRGGEGGMVSLWSCLGPIQKKAEGWSGRSCLNGTGGNGALRGPAGMLRGPSPSTAAG